MKFNPLPSQDFLLKSLRYNKRTGILIWKRRPRKHFKNNQTFVRWNNRYPGTEAFGYVHDTGAKYGAIGNKWFYAHRVIWKLVTGRDPKKLPDHKNRRRSDNRWCNLRLASHSENSANHSLRIDNNSGHAGVYYSRSEKRWKVQINVGRERIYVGGYSTKQKAILARKEVENLYHKHFAPKIQELRQ